MTWRLQAGGAEAAVGTPQGRAERGQRVQKCVCPEHRDGARLLGRAGPRETPAPSPGPSFSSGDAEKAGEGWDSSLSAGSAWGRPQKTLSSICGPAFPSLRLVPGARRLGMSRRALWMVLPRFVLLCAGNVGVRRSVPSGDASRFPWAGGRCCGLPSLPFPSPSPGFQHKVDLLLVSAYASLIEHEPSGPVSTYRGDSWAEPALPALPPPGLPVLRPLLVPSGPCPGPGSVPGVSGLGLRLGDQRGQLRHLCLGPPADSFPWC